MNNAKSLFDSGALSAEEYNKLKESILKKQVTEHGNASSSSAQPGVAPPPEPSFAPEDAYQQPDPVQQQGYQPGYQQQGGGQQYYQQQAGQQYYRQTPYGQDQKSKIAAGLFGIFLGWLGVHNFYLGYTGKAIAQLILSLALGWVFGIGLIISGIWGLIEGIMILAGSINTDAKGIPLKD
ncbi:MAG: NINE protein [Clostridiales Family XIII bacterium]|nr:NINE protein [Clostridiales Family XIII bacterium]